MPESSSVKEEAAPPRDASAPTPAAPPPSEEPSEDWQTRFRYLLAEFDNFRKRTEREREASRREHRAMVLRQLLPLHDAFEQAEGAARERSKDDPLAKGVELIKREWDRFLILEQVVPVAKVGEPFRPQEEDAVGEVPPRGVPPGYIAEVVQQGFRSPGGLLRPAKVLVARRATEDEAAPPAPPATAEPKE